MRYGFKSSVAVILIGSFSSISVALAQDGSVEPDSATSSAITQEVIGTSATVSTSTPRDAVSTTSSPATPIPQAVESKPTPPVTDSPQNLTTTTTSQDQDIPPIEDAPLNPILLVALIIAAMLPFGYLIARSFKNRKKEDDKKENSKCFDLKKLLDEKLKELTDVRSRLEDKAKEKVRDTILTTIEGTATGDAFALLEKTEKEYERLKQLYEECILEFDKQIFKGTIVENSLKDKSILNKVKIDKTYQSGDWILHDVFVDEAEITDLQKSLADQPWYIHFWKPGNDDVRVIYKNKTFNIKFSDKSTWTDAIAYGKSIGIPEEQLDFPID